MGKRDKPGDLSSEDEQLWSSVANTVTPLADSQAEQPEATGDTAPPSRPSSKDRVSARPAKAAPPPEKFTQNQSLDRRTKQKLMRGNVAIEDRIDLHGLTREAAVTALQSFLTRAHARDLRTVLVITGKGNSPYAGHTLHGREEYLAPERTGIIKRAVADWLKDPASGPLVAGFQPAHPKHGGGGAYYVRLRRRRS
jgi:DNA-nicking Smr family endonuclease